MTRRLALTALLLAGCQAEIPDDRLLCATAEPDCPEGFVCCASTPSADFDGRCHRGDACPERDAGAADGGVDAGADDGGRDAGEAPRDGGVDAGLGDAGLPADPAPVDVAAGFHHACVLLDDGSVWCWGDNSAGQLGTGVVDSDPHTFPLAVMTPPPGGLAIDASNEATCVRTASTIECWGSGRGAFGFGSGVLGRAGVTQSSSPVTVMLDDAPHHFDLGAYHACAIVGTDRHLECWGDNDSGQLGLGGTTDRDVPADVGLAGVVDVCAGWNHTCAALDDDRLFCWGNNRYGQLGIGTSGVGMRELSPVEVPTLTGVQQLDCGAQHTCAVAGDGTLYCWGENSSGETGRDPATSTVVEHPQPLVGELGSPTVLAAGGRTGGNIGVTCAASATTALGCFGSNNWGLLGIGSYTPTSSHAPMMVAVVRMNVLDVSAQAQHACAIDEDASGARRILCWGQGDRGQLGNSNSDPSPTPVLVTGFEGGA